METFVSRKPPDGFMEGSIGLKVSGGIVLRHALLLMRNGCPQFRDTVGIDPLGAQACRQRFNKLANFVDLDNIVELDRCNDDALSRLLDSQSSSKNVRV
jgi:hypothetical protein